MKKTYGFTLIELLIVMAIIGILASIIIPSYQHYIKKARFMEVMLATKPYKIAVSMALQDGESMDSLNIGENNIPEAPASTKNLQSLSIESGVITATATFKAGGYTYILTPNNIGAQWTVSGTCVDAGVCSS